MTSIKLTQAASVEGYEGHFLREIAEDGKDLATGWWGSYYSANATDSEGNEYMVYWTMLDDYNQSEDNDEGDACDWDNPVMILDEDGKNVTSKVTLSL